MSTVAFIPARGGSKGVPNKNLKELGGKPLIAWTIEAAFRARLERVVVSTDSEEIAKVGRECGAEVMMRPAELAQDKSSMYEVLKSELPKMEPMPEIVVLLQPTSPFRTPVQIQNALSFFVANRERFSSLVAAETVPEKYNPSQVIVTTPTGSRMANGTAISNRVTRRQDFPNAYVPTGETYIFKTENLNHGSFYGDNVMIFETKGSININTVEDFEEAERQLATK